MNLVKLGDICDFFNGGAWTQSEFTETGYPVLKVSNCKNSGFEVDDVSFIPYEIAQNSENNKLYIGDVIIATVGSHPNLVESAAGRSCIVTKKVQGFYLNQNAVCLRSKACDVLDQRYLGYLAASAPFKHYIQSRGKGAANQMRIAIGAIKEYEFLLPEIQVQRKIGATLAAYDDLIENNQKQIKLLEEAAQRLYKEWFVDMRFPGHETTPITDGIPEGWTEKNIADICTKIGAGGTPSRSNGTYWNPAAIKWFKTGELMDCWLLDSTEKISEEGLAHSSAKLFPPNTILMAIYASPTLGRLGILTTEAACNQAALCLMANESIISWQWLYQKLYELRDEFNAVAKGAGQQNISADVVKKKVIIVPSKACVDRYTSIVAPMFDAIRTRQEQNVQLQEARDRLLPKLMNGEIEV